MPAPLPLPEMNRHKFVNFVSSPGLRADPFVNVTIVCIPGLTVTVAVPAARSLLTSNPALGKVLMPASAIPEDGSKRSSVTPYWTGVVGSA
jgi:hypothetical protein